MAKPRVTAGGGLSAVRYVLRKGVEAGGFWKLYQRLRLRNTCKTCALGMGGQRGGMVNESGHFPEVCKKSVQAQVADMQSAISEDFFRSTPIAYLESQTPAQMENFGRLAFPLLAEPGDTHFRRVSWKEAFDRTGEAFKLAEPSKVFWYASGRSGNEAAYLFQLVARAYGTANIHNCSYYCHQASGVGLARIYGSGTASIVLEDIAKADFVMVIGANPASNHPRLITQLVNLRRRGGKVLVINPLREIGLVKFRIPSDWRSMLFGSDVSDLYLQPKAGTDIALLKALLKGVLERKAEDREYIENFTSGWEETIADIEASSWEELTSFCRVEKEQIDRAVDLICQAKRGVFCWAMGLTHHVHGVDNIQALANLALARGWLGKPGVGMLPIRGHSNVQGVGSVGVTPALKEGFAKKLEEVYGITVPKDPGKDTYASMLEAAEGRIDAALMLGGNLYLSNPDSAWAGKALRRIPFSAYISTKLNPGHVHGRGQTTVILPALVRDEEAQFTTQESMFNYVRLSEGGKAGIEGEMKSEVEIISEIADRILPDGGFDWKKLRSHEALREEIAKVVPGYAAIGAIGKTKEEFQIDGRTFHKPEFKTADGKAAMAVTPLPNLPIKDDEFVLMTIRSEGQFNCVVYEEEDLYRGNRTRDVVMISQRDADRLDLAEDESVIVETDAGQMAARVSIFDIAPGTLAMYYPEANILVTRHTDPGSKTPAYKSVAARVRKRVA
ncbi:MAG: FdhF/YdeP family oxidoreductase [Candidatus Omnitrophica bacterium]|nr:FdhF/YdeP family oxidoreductase [Candidatus Omnitrophota bacterium]